MKKIALILMLFISACSKPYSPNPEISENIIEENYQVLYSPSSNFWSNGGMVEDRILFTRKVSSGSGSYSQYISDNNKYPMIFMPSQVEFLYQGRLIGYSVSNLKFYEIIYKQNKFEILELKEEAIAKLFPTLEFIKISETKNNELKIKKWPFINKNILLLNNTEQDFYRYSFSNGLQSNQTFKSILFLANSGTFDFSHFSTPPILKIKVGL